MQTTLSDEDLLRLCPVNNEVQDILIARYTRMVRSYARRYFLLDGDYDDLVQEGMIGLVNAIRQYQPSLGAFEPFAASCVNNRLISAVRNAAAKKHSPLNESVPLSELSDEGVFPSSLSLSPEEQLIHKERYFDYLISLKKCLSSFETCVLGDYLDGLSCSEIAERVQKPPRSVVNAVQRIKAKAALLLSRR